MTQNSTEQKINQLNVIPKKLVSLFSRAVAKLLLKFNISRHDYQNCLNEQLVLEAKRQNPKATKVELAVRTGIDRRFITGYLNGEMPATKPNKLTLILTDIKWTLNKHYSGNKLPKKGPFQSFESICERWSSGTLTYKAILKELVRVGSVIDHGDDVELVVAKHSECVKTQQHFEVSTSILNRYADTAVHNLENVEIAKQNYQMSAYSTQVSPADINQLKAEIKILLRHHCDEIINLLEEYESDVQPGTYPEYGISVFEFNDNKEK